MFTTRKFDQSSKSSIVDLRDAKPKRRLKRNVPEEYRYFERSKSSHYWTIVFFLVLLLAAAVGGLYYWNQRTPSFQGEYATMQVTAPENVIAGDSVSYIIKYTNNDLVALEKVQLDVQWPEGFYYDASSSEPTDQYATTWKLPNLAAKSSTELKIDGQLVGLKDEVEQAIFRLSYQPANFSSDFEVKQVTETKISDTKLDMHIESPDKILPGQDIALKAVFKNITQETLFDLRVDLTLPPDLKITSMEPTLTDNTWQGDLLADKEMTILIKGTIVADATVSQNWLVEIGQKKDDTFRRLLRMRKDIVLVNPQIQASLKVNGVTRDTTADWGEELKYELNIVNSSANDLTDLTVEVLMDSDIMDWASYQGTGVKQDNRLVWTGSEDPALASLAAGSSANLTWSVKIQKTAKAGRSSVDATAKTSIKGLDNWSVTSPLLIVSVGDGISFSQGAYWNLGGQKVGSGSLPPKVGKSSDYLIVWSLNSGAKNYSSVTLSTLLPPNVSFLSDDQVGEGSMNFDEDTRRLTWQIDDFSAVLLPLQASFNIRLVPGTSDAGQSVTLINPVSLVASGDSEYSSKSGSLQTSQVIASQDGEIGIVVK